MKKNYQNLIEQLAEWFMYLFYDPEYHTVMIRQEPSRQHSAIHNFDTREISNKLYRSWIVSKQFISSKQISIKSVYVVATHHFSKLLNLGYDAFLIVSKWSDLILLE